MLKMSIIGRNACVQTFVQIVDSFVDRCMCKVTMKLNTFIMPNMTWRQQWRYLLSKQTLKLKL